MQHLKHAIRLLTALTVSIAALALSSCSDDFWTAKYKITYDRNGHGTLPYTSLEVESGTVLTSTHLPTLSESGWTFKGWEDTKLGVIEEGDTIQCDLNLVAQWTEAGSTEKFTVTYLSIYGTEPDTIEVSKNATLKSSQLPTLTDSNGEYDFAGWYNKKDSAKTIITADSNFKVTKDIILVAKWVKKGTTETETTEAEVANVAWVSADAGNGKVKLSWTYPSDDFSTVQITTLKKPYETAAASDIVGTDTVTYPTDTITIENLANETKYWFRLVAKNGSGTAATTPVEVTATPTAASTGNGGSGDSGSTGSGDSGNTGGLIILVQ